MNGPGAADGSAVTTVVAALVERDGKLLLARRAPGERDAGSWELPGGKLEPGEDERACLARELREEFGVTAEVGERPFSIGGAEHRGRRWRFVVYRAGLDVGAIELRVHDRIVFADEGDFASLDLAPLDGPALEAWVRARAQSTSNRT